MGRVFSFIVLSAGALALVGPSKLPLAARQLGVLLGRANVFLRRARMVVDSAASSSELRTAREEWQRQLADLERVRAELKNAPTASSLLRGDEQLNTRPPTNVTPREADKHVDESMRGR